MKISVMSKIECERFSGEILKHKCIIISINDSGSNSNIKENKDILNILSLEFDDVIKEVPKCKLNTIEDCVSIKEFVDSYKDEVSEIVIHCTMGISRSSAVACVLSRYLNGDDYYLFKKGLYSPNILVYENMCRAFCLEFDKKDFKKKVKISDRIMNKRLKGYSQYGMDLSDIFI
ncbi:hypothetical protein ACV3RR_04510 [Clostridium perfringens]